MKFADIDKEYTKNKDLKKEDVETLLSWIETQPHLPKIGELEVILFLHSCYYDLEKSKHTIDTYYTCKTHCPEIYENWNMFDPYRQEAMDVMLFHPIPEPTDEGYRIIFIKIQDSIGYKFNTAEQIKIFSMAMKLWLMQEGTAKGHIIVVDTGDVEGGHIIRLDFYFINKFIHFLQEAIPLRLKEIHLFECCPIFDNVITMIRPKLKNEIQLYIHRKDYIKDLYKYVPKKYLPEDYGGLQPSTLKLHAEMKDRLITDAKYLANLEKTQKVNEKLRPGVFSKCSLS